MQSYVQALNSKSSFCDLIGNISVQLGEISENFLVNFKGRLFMSSTESHVESAWFVQTVKLPPGPFGNLLVRK